MKNSALYIIPIGILLAFSACKPTEASYRRAYERAVVNDSTHLALEETIYGQQRLQVRTATLKAGSDSAETKIIDVRPDKAEGVHPEMMKRYCLCVASFKQQFNARSMATRLHDLGWPGAFAVMTTEPYYYVIAASYAEPKQALDALSAIRQNPPLPLKDKFPFILQPSRLSR